MMTHCRNAGYDGVRHWNVETQSDRGNALNIIKYRILSHQLLISWLFTLLQYVVDKLLAVCYTAVLCFRALDL